MYPEISFWPSNYIYDGDVKDGVRKEEWLLEWKLKDDGNEPNLFFHFEGIEEKLYIIVLGIKLK